MNASREKVKKRKALLKNFVGGLAVIIGGPLVYNAIGAFLASDPFVGLHTQTTHPIDETIGIRMNEVELRDYKVGKLVSSAYASRVDVRKDRQAATLYGVKDGLYGGDKGPIHYSASTAMWNFQTKQVTVTNKVAVQNKDLDVTAKGMVFDEQSALLRVQGDVCGKAYGGQIVASTLVYNMKSGAMDAGPVDWQGELSADPQGEKNATPHRWDIKSDHVKSLGSNSGTYVYDNATAKDEDLIIVAPIVQHNKNSDVLTASGGIRYYSGKADIVADRCTVYRKEKRAVLSGHVFMYVKPKSQENDPPKVESLPDFKATTPNQVVAIHQTAPLSQEEQKEKEEEIRSSKNLRDFPLVVVSEKTEYWYGKGSRHAIITGDPQGRQGLKDNEWRHVWSHTALYDGEKETLKLLSSEGKKNALMKNSLGDEMTALDILVSTKEDDDYMEGNQADGHIYSSDEEIPKDDKKGTPPPVKGPVKSGGSGNSGSGI